MQYRKSKSFYRRLTLEGKRAPFQVSPLQKTAKMFWLLPQMLSSVFGHVLEIKHYNKGRYEVGPKMTKQTNVFYLLSVVLEPRKTVQLVPSHTPRKESVRLHLF